MDFTYKEISLCKQIAEKYKKEIKHGDWFIDTKIGGKPFLSLSSQVPEGILIPLWTIPDGFDFLEKREYTFERAHQLGGIFEVWFISGEGREEGSGDTIREACLEIVLAVLEEEKSGKENIQNN